jgi:hypothetical protein
MIRIFLEFNVIKKKYNFLMNLFVRKLFFFQKIIIIKLILKLLKKKIFYKRFY